MNSQSVNGWIWQVTLIAAALAHSDNSFGADPSLEKPRDSFPRVDELFAKFNRPDVPGCAVGIIQNGELVYSRGFGSTNLQYKTPITTHSLFETASFSKAITSICIAILMDEGKIRPDDDLRKFVPEMHTFDPPFASAISTSSSRTSAIHLTVEPSHSSVMTRTKSRRFLPRIIGSTESGLRNGDTRGTLLAPSRPPAGPMGPMDGANGTF